MHRFLRKQGQRGRWSGHIIRWEGRWKVRARGQASLTMNPGVHRAGNGGPLKRLCGFCGLAGCCCWYCFLAQKAGMVSNLWSSNVEHDCVGDRKEEEKR